jgi:hypothetical protein
LVEDLELVLDQVIVSILVLVPRVVVESVQMAMMMMMMMMIMIFHAVVVAVAT